MDDKDLEKALAKESPELLLELKKFETKPHLPPPLISAPFKLFLFIIIINTIAGIIIKGLYYTIAWGAWVPLWLLPLNGIIFLGYGIYVIKKKKGELDIGQTRYDMKIVKMEGEPASLLGLVYIFIGIILIGVVIIRYFIQRGNS